ncbi:MAG: cytochrome b/b6 domain-containing protein, partial [Maritimibacter sp.]
MAARNSPAQFGWVTRLLHWLMALGMIFMLGFGLTLARMQPSLDTLWLYGLHKSIGICLLTLVLLRILWHRISPPPAPLGDQEYCVICTNNLGSCFGSTSPMRPMTIEGELYRLKFPV